MGRYVVAITGASGAVYGVRLVEELLSMGAQVELIVSPNGLLILAGELGLRLEGKSPAESARAVLDYIGRLRKGRGKTPGRTAPKKEGTLTFIPSGDITGAPASGSSGRKAMVICPSSMGTLARIASGISGNLIERAADCVLKERGTLVLVPRETPFNRIHLENMLRLTGAGAVVLPAMPAFYTKPETIEDMVNFVVGKILDVLGIEHGLYKRWKS